MHKIGKLFSFFFSLLSLILRNQSNTLSQSETKKKSTCQANNIVSTRRKTKNGDPKTARAPYSVWEERFVKISNKRKISSKFSKRK